MTPEEVGGSPGTTPLLQHRFTIKNHTFRTKEVLSNFKADAPLGRATRTWSVQEISEDGMEKEGDVYVIRDIWAQSNARSETEIRERLLKLIREKMNADDAEDKRQGEKDWQDFHDYFLEHVAELSGPVTPSPHPLSTGPLRPEQIVGSLSFWATRSMDNERFTLSGSQTPRSNPEAYGQRPLANPSPRPIIQRTHHRDVYKRCCRSYEELRSLNTMFRTLHDGTKGKEPYIVGLGKF
jgi:hypothetical protein